MEDDRPLRIVQAVGGTVVAGRPGPDGSGHHVLVEATPLGGRLAWLLAALAGGPEPASEYVQGRRFYVVAHSAGLDEGLTNLIDALIDLRIGYPGLVQLEVDVPFLDKAGGPDGPGGEAAP